MRMRITKVNWALTTVAGAAALMVACAESPEEQSTSSTEQGYVDGTGDIYRTLPLTIPAATELSEIVLGAGSGGLKINDGVTVSGTGQGIANAHPLPDPSLIEALPNTERQAQSYSLGTTELGVSASVPALWSSGNVTLRNRARAASVHTNSLVAGQEGATWKCGLETQPSTCYNAGVHFGMKQADFKFRLVDYYTQYTPELIVEKGKSVTLDNSITADSFGSVTVRGGATLVLRAAEHAYFMRSLLMESGSALVIDNTKGEVKLLVGDPAVTSSNVDPNSYLTLRGTVTRTVLADQNFLLGYAGDKTVDVGGNVNGVLVAPNAQLNVNTSGGLFYSGAFFGKGIELHQNITLGFYKFQDWKDVAPGDPQLIQTGIFPNPVAREVDNDIQGVAHDGQRWFFTRAEKYLWGIRESYAWSIPYGTHVSAAPDRVFLNPWEDKWDHFGDPTYHAGYLYIPVEQVQGSGRTPVIARVFSVFMGAYVSGTVGTMPQPADPALYPNADPAIYRDCNTTNHAAWLGYNPDDGLIYSSSSAGAACLNAYSMDAAGNVTWVKSIRFRDWQNHPVRFTGSITGGEFYQENKPGGSGNRKLYLAVQGDTAGVVVVDVTRNGLLVTSAHIDHSAWDELEGLDVWPLSNGLAPHLYGDVHVMSLQNNNVTNDEFFFHHFLALNPSEL